MNDTTQALSTIIESSPIDLAMSGWLAAHKKSVRTYNAYKTAIETFRAGLQRMGKDLDADVSTVMLLAQAFASGTMKKPEVSQATYNLRLAILCSFYEYAMSRYLIMPMDNGGHVLNPIKGIQREKVQRYKGVHAIAPEEAMNRLQTIDRSTLLGKRDYALLAILLQTGRRLQEVTRLEWQHVQLAGKGKQQKITLTFEHCKGDKTMVDTLPVSISNALLEWLYAYYGRNLASLEKTTPLWVTLSRNSKQRGESLGIQAVQQLCEKYLGTHAHVTRHTFAHNMIKAGATLPELQARLGHESLATTGIYAQALTSAENPHADSLAEMLGFE